MTMQDTECTREMETCIEEMSPRIRRMKDRIRIAPYEICLARAKYFSKSYQETEGLDPAIRNAHALKKTLTHQNIMIRMDEYLVGSKTEKFLSCPLSVERGDFLRAIQLEMDFLEKKRRPFFMSEGDKKLFRERILPYWDGNTVRDRKGELWKKSGLLSIKHDLYGRMKSRIDGLRFLKYVGAKNIRKIIGAGMSAPISKRRLKELHSMRFDYSLNTPTAAIYCLDVQGHLSLGVDKVVENGMGRIIERIENRLEKLERESPDDNKSADFLRAAKTSLEAAIMYSERFSRLAESMVENAKTEEDRTRLKKISEHCKNTPRNKPRTFHEAIQAAWMTQVVGEIQYGCMDVFTQGRIDQFLYPYYKQDIEAGVLSKREARELLQEYFLKLSANITPTPEVGMESNGVLGNSQHCIIIGGQFENGDDATNELSQLCLEAYAQMGGTVNQLCVRIHNNTPLVFLENCVEVFNNTNGIAFYNDEVIIEALLSDGLSIEDARNYVIIGCVETSGQSNTHGCVGGHDLVLPAVLLQTLSCGELPPPALGQCDGFNSGNLESFVEFEDMIDAIERQMKHQIGLLIESIAAKDLAHRDLLPAPYVSALMDGCIENAKDITAGGSKYDFTGVAVRGLATFIDSLLAIKYLAYEKKLASLPEILAAIYDDFRSSDILHSRIIKDIPKYGTSNREADKLTLRIIDMIHREISQYKNIRGGRYRVAYYSFGNHVIDGFILGTTPDGRKRGEPISNGCSPSNLADLSSGPLDCFSSIAKFPPEKVSCGISLNMRFHPNMIKSENGRDAFAKMVRTYFKMGGMHVQPTFVSYETLIDAQKNPEAYKDLVVKVSGYSAYFTDLGESIQEDIIDRYQFGT